VDIKTTPMLTVLIACDKFKGSLQSREVAEILQKEITSRINGCQVFQFPMADGGEGLTNILVERSKGSKRLVVVRDPLFRPYQASYGISDDKQTAFIEMAAASGLELLTSKERNPSITTTFGTGELIRDALELGIRKFIIGIGGSATHDGGLGVAKALGIKAYDLNQRELEPVGKSLRHVHQFDLSEVHPMLKESHFTLLVDVNAPAFGAHGAAQIFARQKGADTEMVEILEEGMRHYVSSIKESSGKESNFPGAGAGGGLPIFFKVFTSCDFVSGANFLTQSADFQKLLGNSDVVITGEGKLDHQTLQGKVVEAVERESKKHGKKLLIIVGQNTLSPSECAVLNAERIVSLKTSTQTEEECMQQAERLLRQSVKNEIIPFLQSARVD
jgi:glycerate kinase